MTNGDTISIAEAEQLHRKLAARSLPIFSAFQLGNAEFPAIRFIVPKFIPEGATILAGRPKLGKSWLGLDIALAVASGGKCLGVECTQGSVLYLALEDNKRRLKSRLQKLSPAGQANLWPRSLCFATEWRRHDSGGLEDISTWAASVENPRLVIVDVLAQFKGGRNSTETQYEADYSAVKGLQKIAGDLRIGILIIHHVRKGVGEIDPFEKVSGTLGLTGAADTTIVLDRGSAGCTLYCRGRDIQEYERAIGFDKFDCLWTVQGSASAVHRTDERNTILEHLENADEPMSPSEVAAATGMARNNAKQLLFKMSLAGEVAKVGRGRYVHSDRIDPLAPDNLDNQITSEDDKMVL